MCAGPRRTEAFQHHRRRGAPPEVSKFLTDRIVEPWGSTQEELGRTIEGDIAQWGPIVKKLNITV